MGRPMPELGKIDALDVVRGCAVLAVVVCHAFYPLQREYRIEGNTEWAAFNILAKLTSHGVDAFFVLSGYLITRILLTTRDDPHYYRTFYARRTLRIFPPYYLFLVAVFGLMPLAVPLYRGNGPDVILWYALYLANYALPLTGAEVHGHIAHLWTLCVEEQFYLIWPFVVRCAGFRWLPVVACGIVVASPFVRLGLSTAGVGDWAVWTMSVTRADGLALGGFLAWVHLSRGLAGLRWVIPIGAVAFIGYLGLGVIVGEFTQSDWRQVGPGLSLVALASSGVVAAAVRAGRSFTGVQFVDGWLATVGKYSYTIYLVHGPIPAFAHRLIERVAGADLPWPVMGTAIGVITGVTSYLLAWVSWRVYERPILGLKRHFAYRTAESVASPPQTGRDPVSGRAVG